MSVDQMVKQARDVLADDQDIPGVGRLLRSAEVAIRFGQRRWLLLTQKTAETFHEAEDAALAWAESSATTAWLIDLQPSPSHNGRAE